ncbi:HIT domain-containing protein [Nocardia goodfellowii]
MPAGCVHDRINDGPAAEQSIAHLHIHIVPAAQRGVAEDPIPFCI